jgi:hypothetical protein
MRKRFEQQMSLGQIPISDVKISTKCRDAFPKLLRALQELYTTPEFNQRVFNILEDRIVKGKKATGRKGMDLWILFVMAQTRLCLNISYDRLFHMANNDRIFRQIMGVEYDDYMKKRIEFGYQNIIDNVTLLDDQTLLEINCVIVEMGHNVFKKKGAEPLRLKTDSFVVESNVHFPTDYNLLFDCGRKCLDIIRKLVSGAENVVGWRKIGDWRNGLKSLMRGLGQSYRGGGKNKDARIAGAARDYINKARLLNRKIEAGQKELPLESASDLLLHLELDRYRELLAKHIDLVDRRILNNEDIPHCEKLFSIFEQYTEWITKGKLHPNVELGKNVQVTSDQFHLIVDYRVMEKEVDKCTVITLADRILQKWGVASWSFDKGFFTRENKELLKLYIQMVVMPKKGKLNLEEKEEENGKDFKKLRNKHSAIESNINELECKGLDRCPDRGYKHFKTYVAIGVCAYNLHKIGAELLKQEKVQARGSRLKNAA